MSDATDPVADLAALIERVSGNVILPGHYPFLAETAKRRAVSLRLAGVPAYVRALALGDLPGEWSCLLPHVTIKESFLFRHPQHFAALASTVLPRLAAAHAGRHVLRVWSAGCARGEEPTTLAIVLAECSDVADRGWRILATDVDEEALAAARTGVFGERAVSQVPAHLRERYFVERGDSFEVSPEIARRIEYRVLNLVHEPLPVEPGSFDVVFLRNVLIYFRPDSQRRVAAAIARTLTPNGVLFLGPAETLWQISGELEPVDLEDCFCYRHATVSATAPGVRAPGSGVRGELAAQESWRRARPREVASPSTPEATAQPQERAPAARDVHMAAGNAEPPEGVAPVSGARSPQLGFTGTQERLAAAVRSLTEDRIDRAAELLDQALLADPSDPATHAFEGFLHDVSGRTQMAVASYRATLFLDPGLFQVRLLLADALRRLGNEQRAALEYREVMATLAARRGHPVEALAKLPLPDGEQALQRCREALQGRSN